MNYYKGESMNELPCIVCAKVPESVENGIYDNFINTPYAGTVFTSEGHYGSTVFDPMNFLGRSCRLEITVCDECLKVLKNRVYKVESRPRRPEETYIAWEGEPE